MIGIGSVIVQEETQKVGIVTGERFNSHPLKREIRDDCWIVRSVEATEQLVIKKSLCQIGNPPHKWKCTTLKVNTDFYGIEAFTLEEIKILISGEKLPYLMTKQEFLAWTETMFKLAQAQRKFGLWDTGLITTRCLVSTIKTTERFYLSFTEDELQRFSDIANELWGMGYSP